MFGFLGKRGPFRITAFALHQLPEAGSKNLAEV